MHTLFFGRGRRRVTLALQSAEVYKGGNGLAYGSSTLGGAIDFRTPTAYTAIAPNIVRLEGGSYGTVRGSAQFFFARGRAARLYRHVHRQSCGRLSAA
jgi:outer membrane receptor protein involved in Fe transport